MTRAWEMGSVRWDQQGHLLSHRKKKIKIGPVVSKYCVVVQNRRTEPQTDRHFFLKLLQEVEVRRKILETFEC